MQTTAIKFGEDDVFVREGNSPRSVPIERKDVSYPIGVKVYLTTIEGYKRGHMGCNLTLDEIGVQEAQIDPAEGTYMYRPHNRFVNVHYIIMKMLTSLDMNMSSHLKLMFVNYRLTLKFMMISYQRKKKFSSCT